MAHLPDETVAAFDQHINQVQMPKAEAWFGGYLENGKPQEYWWVSERDFLAWYLRQDWAPKLGVCLP